MEFVVLSHLRTRAIAATVFALPLIAITAKSAFADNLRFTLNNATGHTLVEFYASPTDVDSWEDDILGANVLPSGESTMVTIADGRSQCEYDIKGVFDDGESVERFKVNLCHLNGGVYQFTENQ